jgi:hypothetical protein
MPHPALPTPALATLLAALLASPPGAADPVFRCLENGKTVYSAKPGGASCQSMDLKVIEADPREAARQRRETELWNEERTRAVQQSLAQEAKAEAQRRRTEVEAVARQGAAREGASRRRASSARDPSRNELAPTPIITPKAPGTKPGQTGPAR